MQRLTGLAWAGSADPRILILGSFPSIASLALGHYYGNGRNHFWDLVAAERPALPPGYEERLQVLAEARIALWDVIASCEREGSLDAAIRGEAPNDILGFVALRPGIGRIALNGSKAAEAFRRHIAPSLARDALPTGRPLPWEPSSLPGRRILLCRLPSSSPIPTREHRGAADKAGAWTAFLSPDNACGPPSGAYT